MPRKQVLGGAAGLKVTQIMDYFRKVDLKIAQVALDLSADAVRQRLSAERAIVNRTAASTNRASEAASASSAVDAATASATAAPRKKPGPPKGYKAKHRKAKKGATTATTAANDQVQEVTGADLPPQDLPLGEETGEPVHVG